MALIGPEYPALEKYIRQNREDTMLVQIGIKVLLIQDKQSLSDSKQAVIEQFLIRELNFHISQNDEISSGMAAYNLGNHFRSKGMHLDAIKYHLLARKHNPFYRDAHYYYSDLAGSLFECGKYKFAVGFYSKSIELGSNSPLIKALLADALMYTGEYQKAVEKFDEYLLSNVDSDENEEWYLKHSLLSSLLVSGYPPNQKRAPEEADLLVTEGHNDRAIEADFLCESAWYNLGVQESKSSSPTNAFVAFTFSALLYRGDPEVWAQSLMYGLFASADINFLIWIVRTAHFHTGQNFIDNVVQKLRHNKINGEAILKLIDKTIVDKSQTPITVRIFTDNGVYDELNI